MLRNRNSILLKFSNEFIREHKFPLPLSLFFETISSFQIIGCILQASFPSDSRTTSIAFNIFQYFIALPGVFSDWNVLITTKIFNLIWFSCIAYLICYGVLLLIIFIGTVLHIKSNYLAKFLTLLSLAHSRLFYYPIFYLFLQTIRNCIDNPESKTFLTIGSTPAFIISVIFAGVSLAFSLFKEFLCYRINKDKSTYSSKNNLYYQLVLTVKTAILAVYVLSSASNEAASYAVGILSIVYSIIALYFLYNKLPFYNLTLMQYSFLLTSSTFAVSIFALISIGDPKEKTIRSLTFIFVIFCVRFLYARLVRLFEEILGGVFDTPERAIHFPILLKKYTSKNDGLISVNEEFPYESLYFYSFSGVKMNDPNRPPDMKVSDFMHKDFYSMFLKKCSEERINYKKSEVFLLYLAKSFIKKSRNTFQALNLMEEVQSMSSSIPVRNSVDNFYSKIRGTYEKMIHQSAASLELSYYFHCRDELAIIKKDMQAEIKLHLEFWKEISGDNVNVKRIIDISENINSVHSRIKKCWKKNEHNFPKVYLSSLILYGLYFDFIRGMPQESIPIIRKFYTHHKSNSFKNKSELISSTSAVIVASLEKEKLGVVTDASDTVMTLFNIAKDRFVGMKINSIMPDFIGKQHDRYMQKYSQDSKSHELDRKIHSYAKTLKGEIMELDINLKIYPYLDKGINLMGYVQKNAEETQMIIVNSDGTIVESSPSLIKTLRLASSGLTLKKINLQDICPKFEKINSAFNTYYQKDIQPHFGAYEESFITMKSPTGANNYQNPFFSKGTYLPFQSSVTYFTEKGNKDDENPLMMFGSPPQSPDALRNPLASPGVFHSPTTLPNFYESGSLAKGPFTQGETRTKTLLSKEEAEEICKKYEERGNLRFFTYDQGIRKSVTEYKKDGVMINVSIKPYIFEGNVYKVVKLIDIHSRKGIDLVETSSLNLLPKQNSKLTKSEDEIEEESSDIDRSETPSKAINDNTGIITIPDEREPEFGGRDKRKDVSLLFKLQKIEDDEIQSPGESKPKTLNMEQQSQANLEGGVQVKLLYQQLGGALKSKKLENEEELMPVKENFQNIDLRNSVTGAGSSTASFSHMDLKLIKKLTDVFEVRRIRPLTKVSIFGVYFVMIAVLVLTFVNFAITQKSLKQNESGADILNTLGTRLSNTVVAWEWLLMFYSRLLGLRPLFSVYGYSRQVIYNSTLTTEELNGDLMTMLGSLDNEDIVNQVLAKNIKFYNADRTLLYSDELLDSFSASNLLILQNFFIGKYSGLDAVLVKRPEFITLSNNTANDYLVSCEAQIKQVFNTLQTISNNNITQSEKILIFENIALIALYISLVFVGRVVTQSFAKTFQALIKIKKTSVTERIKHIKTFETLLNENLEGQSYPRNFDAYLNGLTSKAIVHEPAKQKNTGTGHFSKNYVLKDLVMHIFKFNLASIILILIISGMFLALYLQSQSSFTSLNRQTEQLYMINKVSYESALVVANFYYVVIYQNDTSMLIRNEQPLTQLAKNLEVFSEVNEQLLAAYGSTADKDMDPVIREIFEGSICEFTKASIASNCEIASQGYTLGLLGINSFAMTTSTNYINSFTVARPIFGRILLANQTIKFNENLDL